MRQFKERLMHKLNNIISLKEAILSSSFDAYSGKDRLRLEKNKDNLNKHRKLLKAFSDDEIFIYYQRAALRSAGYVIVDLHNSWEFLSSKKDEVLEFITKYEDKLNSIKKISDIRKEVLEFFNRSTDRFHISNILITPDIKRFVTIRNGVIKGIHSFPFKSEFYNKDVLNIFNSLTDDQKAELEYLYLPYINDTKAESIDLSPCRKLKQLSISGDITDITKIKGLDELKKLNHLELRFTGITKIKGLDKLTNLTKLSIFGNEGITKIEGLDKLTNLTKLELHKNKITRIENLDKLINLEYLDLQHNPIKKIENLDMLTNLKVVDARKTEVSKDNLDNFNFRVST